MTFKMKCVIFIHRGSSCKRWKAKCSYFNDITLDSDVDVEIYLGNAKKENVNFGNNTTNTLDDTDDTDDKTVASGKLQMQVQKQRF